MKTKTKLQDATISSQCSVVQTLNIIGDKWSLILIREALYGVRKFSDFQERLGISKNILSKRLDKLVNNGIFIKSRTRPRVERFEYTLTERGKELLPVIVALMQWGDKWVYGNQGEPIVMFDRRSNAPIQKLGVFSVDGRYLRASDLSYEAGPGATDEMRAIVSEMLGSQTPENAGPD